MLFLTISIFFWDFFSGSDTLGFGVLDPYRGMPMFYVYMISFFSSLLVVYAINRIKIFGIGFLMWLPHAVIGIFVETYFELDALLNFWCAIGYCAFGLITGLSADLAFKILEVKTSLKQYHISGITRIIMNIVYYFLIIVAIGFFYKTGWGAGAFDQPGTFLGVAYFGLPWMLLNAYFGGFTAYFLDSENIFNKKK